jgi:prolyl oligopeptidase
MKRLAVASALCAMMIIDAAEAAPRINPQPVAPRIPETDDYFGTRIVDPYRWMETRSDPRFISWLKAEDAHARSVLATIPGIDALQSRIAAHGGAIDRIVGLQPAGGKLFYLKRPAGEQTAKLYVIDGGASERLLVDPDRFAGAGTHGAIDYFKPSPDGSKIAISISTGGSENGVIHVVETSSGKLLADAIDRVEQGAPSWLPDGSGFFYNRFAVVPPGAPETEKYFNSRAMLHRLGTDTASDIALIGTGVAGSPAIGKVDFPFISAFAGSRWAVALISHGAIPALDVLVAPLADVLKPGASWRKIAETADQVTDAQMIGDRLYLLSHRDAPRYKLLVLDAATGDLTRAVAVVPTSARVLQGITIAKDAIYLQDLDGGIGKVRRLDLASGTINTMPLPEGSAFGVSTDPLASGAVLGVNSWLTPDRFYAVGTRSTSALQLAKPPTEDTSAFVAEEVRAPSWDGTMIPLSIVHRRDIKLNGRNPVWLTGYGAYGAAITPAYIANYIPFLEDGGVYAVAHVRGGGEFGEDWHLAGFQKSKPNTFKDLIACAEFLHKQGYGSPATTAIQGRSAGGITVGMATTARPDLFRVVFNGVGDNNTLRAEHGTDGEANALEYGSTATKEGFDALYAVDATQHVRPGIGYPAVLLTTGYNDPRVAPFQPGKMAAHLQAATSSGRPVLLRVDFDAGHGMGSTRNQREKELAEQMGFLYWQIGRPGYQPR